MDNNQIIYPVFEVSDVDHVTVCLDETDIKSFELNDFEVSGAKLIDSEGYEVIVEGKEKKTRFIITKLFDFLRGGQTIKIKGRGARDLDTLKYIVLNFCEKNEITSTDDWRGLLDKIRSKKIIW